MNRGVKFPQSLFSSGRKTRTRSVQMLSFPWQSQENIGRQSRILSSISPACLSAMSGAMLQSSECEIPDRLTAPHKI
jgi:hypothetical protein